MKFMDYDTLSRFDRVPGLREREGDERQAKKHFALAVGVLFILLALLSTDFLNLAI
jgi:hypothetical protein